MKTEVGLWMDHRKAVIVVITDKGEEIKVIVSKVEKQLRRSGGSPLKGPYEASKCQQTTATRERLQDISTFTTMRSLRAFVVQKRF